MKKDIEQKINTEEFKKLFEEFGNRQETILNTLKPHDDLLNALGKLVRNFEIIAWNLQEFIIEINIGRYDGILLSRMSFKESVGILSSLCNQENFMPGEIKSLSRWLNNAEEIRNRLLHSMWIGMSRYKKNKKSTRPLIEEYTIDDFKGINESFEKLIVILEELIVEYRKRKKS